MPRSFADLGVPADVVTYLASRRVLSPYPVQAATLPGALGGLDVAAQSPTGSGKTLAYGIPIALRAERARPGHPSALVLAPTRELAAQIAAEVAGIAMLRQRRVATFYGGVGFGTQLTFLRKGVDIAVACPGRLLDLVEQRALVLSHVRVVVIDEADRMADMGFLPVVKKILEQTSRDRQTLLFSATLGGDVERLVLGYQRSPQRHVLDAPSDDIGSRTHRFVRVDHSARAATTAGIVAEHASSIVFCRTKHGADRLARQLLAAGITAAPIHGDRSQAQRDRALAAFHARTVQVLVGTDVAARGIHVEDVGCVVHFDPPEDGTTYLHRSGRTGRAGADGTVVSLVTDEQEPESRRLRQRLGLAWDADPDASNGSAHLASRPRTSGPRTSGPRTSGPHSPAPRSSGPQATGPRAPGSRPGKPRPGRPQQGGSRPGRPRR